ncbi:substrate-binding periplasmic protein [Desulfovibrio cuneatus]|uniref:substrate-binding periplasmic protein n=1 Tax=Desulfovibrio cuneatus TaxID=159728 RepID=UPI0003FB7C85|nr:transporter substrate-binding domain-containing protein [Desulfovibrio cuneatus]
MRFFVLTFFLVFGGACCAAASPSVLRVAVEAYYSPFAYKDKATGALAGFDYDMAQALCRSMNRTCEIQAVAFDEIIPRLQRNELDMAVAGMGRTPEREKVVLFSDRYYRASNVFLGVGFTALPSKEGLRGKRLGAQGGTFQEVYLRKNYGDATIITFAKHDEAIEALRAGKVDLVFLDSLVAYNHMRTDADDTVEVVGPPVMMQEDSRIVLRKGLEKERKAVNQAIMDLRSSGEYDNLSRKYFEFSIY